MAEQKNTTNAATNGNGQGTTSPAPQQRKITSSAKQKKVAAAKANAKRLDAIAKNVRNGLNDLSDLLKKSSSVVYQLGLNLIEAKKLVEAGLWIHWLTQHCQLTIRQAQKYMRLAGHWDKLKTEDRNPADFSIDDNLALLASLTVGPEKESKAAEKQEVCWKVTGEQEIQHKKQLAHRLMESVTLDFSPESAAGKLVQGIVAYAVQQIRKRAPQLKPEGEAAEPLDPIVVAIAVLNKVRSDLSVQAVVEVVEPEGDTAQVREPASNGAAAHEHLNGAATASMA